MTSSVFVGADDGYADTKIVVLDPQSNAISQFIIPSNAQAGSQGISDLDGKGDQIGGYKVNNERFTVGLDVNAEDTRYDQYPLSSMNHAIIHHALREAGVAGKDVSIATGLPLQHFYTRSGTRNDSYINEKVKRLLEAKVEALDGKSIANIVSHDVYSEAITAWMDYVISTDGQIEKSKLERSYGVVDIGGRTTDFAVVLPGKRIDHKRSGSEMLGVLDLVDKVRKEICLKFDLDDFPLNKAKESLRNNEIWLWGENHNVTDLVNTAKTQIGQQLQRAIQVRFGDAAMLDRILFVGGGAAVLESVTETFRNGHTPDTPAHANARGMVKYLALAKQQAA